MLATAPIVSSAPLVRYNNPGAVVADVGIERPRVLHPEAVPPPDKGNRSVVRTVIDAASEWGGSAAGVVDSGLPGPKGNREFFVHLVHRPDAPTPDDIDRWIDEAVGA